MHGLSTCGSPPIRSHVDSGAVEAMAWVSTSGANRAASYSVVVRVSIRQLQGEDTQLTPIYHN
jgi:hypothetical protein